MSRNFRRIRRPDVVTLRVATINGVLRITGSCVIGSAAPCLEEIQVGNRLSTARECLIRHGFVLITIRSNVRVFRRFHDRKPHHRPRPRPC